MRKRDRLKKKERKKERKGKAGGKEGWREKMGGNGHNYLRFTNSTGIETDDENEVDKASRIP